MTNNVTQQQLQTAQTKLQQLPDLNEDILTLVTNLLHDENAAKRVITNFIGANIFFDMNGQQITRSGYIRRWLFTPQAILQKHKGKLATHFGLVEYVDHTSDRRQACLNTQMSDVYLKANRVVYGYTPITVLVLLLSSRSQIGVDFRRNVFGRRDINSYSGFSIPYMVSLVTNETANE